jgi:capsule polysaccharide export protein KpsE/RkpR
LGLPARWKSVWTPRSAPPINNAIADLREVLGNQTYESAARKGETMTTAEMVAYAYDQIDQARAELNAVSK